MTPIVYALLLIVGTGNGAALLDSERRFDSLAACKIAEQQENNYTGGMKTTARCVNVSYFYGGE